LIAGFAKTEKMNQSSTQPARTRFAPSPTGFLHIGGVRTALFNWLLARQTGGQFVLRIDDTDQSRNVEETLEPILEGFKWLGIDWDEGPQVGGPYEPYFQSQRSDRYQKAVDALLACGAAYRDFSKPEEFQAEREAAEKEKRNFVYSRKWMAENDEQVAAFEAEGRVSVVRLKTPRDGKCEFHDLVRGDVSVNWSDEADHVIQRADGSFIYHLANVVDDEDFKITHVVRAVEHLSNTPRQIYLIQALGYQLPIYAHIPFVAEPGTQRKLSKRNIAKYLKNRDFKKFYDHGLAIAKRLGIEENPDTFNPVLVKFYQEIGYLPETLLNYLLMLGWSFDDKKENFTAGEMIEHFSLARVVKNPASFDPQKLAAFQERKMTEVPLKQKSARCLRFLQNAGVLNEPADCEVGPYLQSVVEAAGDRIKVAGDILDFEGFFQKDDDLSYDEKAFEKRLVKPENAGHLLSELLKVLEASDDFSAAALESAVNEFVENMEIKFGDIIHGLRIAVTGKPSGFGMFESMEVLGKDRCLTRIRFALEELDTMRQHS